MAKITIRSAEALKPNGSESFLWDSELRGFGLRCSPKGKKVFIVQYRHKGRTRRMSLGQFGAITPNEAREIAQRHLGDVARGTDPSGELQLERKAPNMSALCDRFIETHANVRCKPNTAKEYARVCERFIKPRLGGLRVQAVTRRDIAALHEGLSARPYAANRMLSILSKMFNLAELWGIRPDGSNPCRHVQKYAERKRERFLMPNEIDRLWHVLDDAMEKGTETVFVVTAFKLLLLTGCRLREILTLKWSYIRGDVIWLPDAKTGPRRVLLNAKALELLHDLPRLNSNDYVIAGTVPGQHATDLHKPWSRIRAAAELEDVRIHDLRHTYASIAAMAGHSLPMIGYLLGHTQAQTTQRYVHLVDDTARRAANEVNDLFGSFITAPSVSPKTHIIKLVHDASEEDH